MTALEIFKSNWEWQASGWNLKQFGGKQKQEEFKDSTLRAQSQGRKWKFTKNIKKVWSESGEKSELPGVLEENWKLYNRVPLQLQASETDWATWTGNICWKDIWASRMKDKLGPRKLLDGVGHLCWAATFPFFFFPENSKSCETLHDWLTLVYLKIP